nr:PAS domain S-box protein [Pseudomonas aeruginosa]
MQGADFDLPLQGGGDQRLAQAVVGMEYPQLQGCGFQIAHGNSGVGAVERRCPYLHIESHTPEKVPANGIRRPRRGLPKGRPSSWGEPASGRKTFFVLPCWVGRFEKEGWRVRKDGSRFWANVVIDPIRDSDGRLIGFAKVTRDITHRIEAERELERARQELFQAQKMESLGHLTGGVAGCFPSPASNVSIRSPARSPTCCAG